MDRCRLQGAVRDALRALRCAVGYNIRWLLRAIARVGLGGLFCAYFAVVICALSTLQARTVGAQAPQSRRKSGLIAALVPWFSMLMVIG